MPLESNIVRHCVCDSVRIGVGASFATAIPAVASSGGVAPRPAFGRLSALNKPPKRINVYFHLGIIAALLAGCASNLGAGCDAWKPILITPQDALARSTAADILAHNLTGRRLCGW